MAKKKPTAITWTNERRKLADLIPWEHNPRVIKQKQAERLVDSVETFGQVETLAHSCITLVKHLIFSLNYGIMNLAKTRRYCGIIVCCALGAVYACLGRPSL